MSTILMAASAAGFCMSMASEALLPASQRSTSSGVINITGIVFSWNAQTTAFGPVLIIENKW